MTTRKGNSARSPAQDGNGGEPPSPSSFGPLGKKFEEKIQSAGIEGEVGIFESYTLLVSCIGMLEVGFLYSTMFCVVLMTVAFAEMMQL